jgi:Sulfotransferase family
MFWSMLRSADNRYRTYFEPLHGQLLEMVDDDRIVPYDPTHAGVRDKFAEYRDLDRQALGTLWRPWFSEERFLLERDDEAPDLEAYLRFLIDSSSLCPVIKFTRATFRVRWLRERFPEARIVHLVREPRAIWASMWRQDREAAALFIPHSEAMSRDIGLDLPADPYSSFYALMLLADELCKDVVDDRWAYEAAVSDYTAWSNHHLIERGLLEAVPPLTVRDDPNNARGPHESRWYDDQEEYVRSVVGHSVERFVRAP